MQHQEHSPSNEKYREFEYQTKTLQFLRQMLDSFTIDVFRQVAKKNSEHKGFVKTRLDNYPSMRKKIDSSFLILESQGFIEKQKDGTSHPYYLTIRGKQLITLLKNEKKMGKENIN